MAKNNMLLGYARGKVGDLVFQRRKGEQIVKARNRNPANPRTWAQQMQRVRMYAPVQFYKTAIERFYKFAFEDKKTNETDYNAFIRENLNAFQGPYYTKEQVQQKIPVIAPYVISSGTLGQIPYFPSQSNTRLSNNIRIRVTTISDTNRNVGYISQYLINNYGLEEGDMLTFIMQITTGLTVGNNGDVKFTGSNNFMYLNFNIDSTSEVPIPEAITENGNAGIVLHNRGTVEEPQWVLAAAYVDEGLNNVIFQNAIITTRRKNSKILASTSRMRLNQQATTFYEAMSTSQQLLRAAASYDATIAPLDPDAAKVMTESSSQTNVQQGRSTEQTAFNCLPSSGKKTTDGNPAYTLENNCPSCGCDTQEPSPCGDETVTTTTTTTTRKRTTKTVEEE